MHILLISIYIYQFPFDQMSKLRLQLDKEKISKRPITQYFDEAKYLDVYANICKIQPKNLMLVEFLVLLIEKGFLKNYHKLTAITDLILDVMKQKFQDSHLPNENNNNKFGQKKFLQSLKQLAKKLYPGDPNAYSTSLFDKITSLQPDQSLRMKIDDSIKKTLTLEVISVVKETERLHQVIFEVYMPENFNEKLGFTSKELKILQKKLPIICFLRFLYQAEVVPQFVTVSQFLEIVCKLIPPTPQNLSPKENIFYTMQTFSTYVKDYLSIPTIKLLEGDIGFTFFEFQMMLIRFSTEFCKDQKQQYSNNLIKFLNYIKIREAVEGEPIPRQTKAYQSIRSYLITDKKHSHKINLPKRESKQKLQDLLDLNDQHFDLSLQHTDFESATLLSHEIQAFQKIFEEEFPPLPPPEPNTKQNDGPYDPLLKHVVIGDQLPVIAEKNKPISKEPKQAADSKLMGYLPEINKKVEVSINHLNKLMKRNRKGRQNNQYPIILTQIIYPSFVSSLSLSSNAQIYLEATYINLGERLYQKAYGNFCKARSMTQLKSLDSSVFFLLLEAQIFQTAGKDQISLKSYMKAKFKLFDPSNTSIFSNSDTFLPFTLYNGLASCLYHLQEYQYAFRCFLKAKEVRGNNLISDSIENALLENNFGCCLMMLNRNKQAIKHFDLSECILDLKVGRFDERTLVAQQNGIKNKKCYVEMMPSFKTMWKTYVQKTNIKNTIKTKK